MSQQRFSSKAPVAVVGTGLAGLVTAYLLHNDPQGRYHVTLFEKVKIGCSVWHPALPPRRAHMCHSPLQIPRLLTWCLARSDRAQLCLSSSGG